MKERTLIRQPMPKKSKIKEGDVNDEDYVPVSIFTNDSQPTVTRSTSWSATPLASLDHSYSMNKENFPSYSDLADEIKVLKIEFNILKSKIKTSKTTS